MRGDPCHDRRVDGGEATARMHAEAVSDAVLCVRRTVPDAIEAFR